MNETVLAALIGGAAGVLPVVVTRVFGRMESRSVLRRQVQSLDLAKRRVDFMNAWMSARRNCLPREVSDAAGKDVLEELEEIRGTLKTILGEAGTESKSYGERSFMQRLLLAYKPRRMAGWWWRLAFYMWSGAVIASIIDGVTRKGFYSGRDGTGEFSVGFLVGELIGTVLLMLPSVFFHRRAVRADLEGGAG